MPAANFQAGETFKLPIMVAERGSPVDAEDARISRYLIGGESDAPPTMTRKALVQTAYDIICVPLQRAMCRAHVGTCGTHVGALKGTS